MAQAYLTTGSQYNPYTFEEMLKPLLLYKEEYDTQTKAYEDYNTNAEAIRAFLDPTIDKDTLNNVYNPYMQELNDAASALSKGLTPQSKETLRKIKSDYNRNILSIKAGIEGREKARQQWNELSAKDRTLMTSHNPNYASVSEYMNGKSPESINVSGAELMQRAYNIAQRASKNNILNPQFMKVMGDQYYQIKQSYGFDSPEMDSFLSEHIVGIPVIDSMISEILSSSNVDKLSPEDQTRAIKYALEGAFNGIEKGATYSYQTNQQWALDNAKPKEGTGTKTTGDTSTQTNTLGYDTSTNRQLRKKKAYFDTLQQTANGNLIDPSDRLTEDQYTNILNSQAALDYLAKQVSSKSGVNMSINDFIKWYPNQDTLTRGKFEKEYTQATKIQNEINRLIPNQHNTQELVKEYDYLGLGTQYDNVKTGLDYQEQQLASPFVIMALDSSKISNKENIAENILGTTVNFREVDEKGNVSKGYIKDADKEKLLSHNYELITSNKHSILIKDKSTNKLYKPDNDDVKRLDVKADSINNELKDFSPESLNSFNENGFKQLPTGYIVKLVRGNINGQNDIVKILYNPDGTLIGMSSIKDEAYNGGKSRGAIIQTIMQSILEEKGSK